MSNMQNTLKRPESIVDDLLIEDHGALRWLILNRPAKMNALSHNLINALTRALDEAQAESSVKMIALTGKGKAFCAGADLIEFERSINAPAARPDFLDSAGTLNARLRHFPKPTIAAVNGFSSAGGLELVLCCDLAVAVETASMGDAHANYAAFPGGGGASILPSRVGINRAKHLLFTGKLLPAGTWFEWGLLAGLVAGQKELRHEVEKIAAAIIDKSPLVIREMKRIANMTETQPQEVCIAEEMAALRELCGSADMREGFAAFREKREPLFKGR